MAIIVTDHVSREVGHLRGVARVLTTLGMVLVALGVMAFVGAIAVGLFAGGGETRSLQMLPLGGLSVVVGTLVASAGMTLGRRSAGE